MHTEYVVIRHAWSRAPGQTCLSLSLFGGLCSQTASPLLLCIWLARMAKGKGYKCRVGTSLHFLSSYAVSTAGRFLTHSLSLSHPLTHSLSLSHSLAHFLTPLTHLVTCHPTTRVVSLYRAVSFDRKRLKQLLLNVMTEELLTFVLHVTYMYTACM